MANDKDNDQDAGLDDIGVAIYLAVFMENNGWARIGEENGWLRVYLLQSWLRKTYPGMYARILKSNAQAVPLDELEEKRLNTIISQFRN